jgi:hypothetical protein
MRKILDKPDMKNAPQEYNNERGLKSRKIRFRK